MLSAKLTALMPMEPDAEQRIEDTNARFDGEAEYTVTATPASGWYGIAFGEQAAEAIGDTAGAPVSLSFSSVGGSDGYSRLVFSAGASATGTDEGQASIVFLNLRHRNAE